MLVPLFVVSFFSFSKNQFRLLNICLFNMRNRRGIQRGCVTPTGATFTKSEKNSFIENPQTDPVQYK